MASLNIVSGPTAGTRIDLVEEHSLIGRSPDCQVVVPLTSVSRQHARITRRGGRHVLEDLDSRGGTWLNQRTINGLSPLRDGDRLRICDFVAAFESTPQPMTEAGCLGSTSSQALLGWLRGNGGASERRRRLFVAACWLQFGLPTRQRDAAAALIRVEERAEGTGWSDDLVGLPGAPDLWQVVADAARQAVEDASSPWPRGRPEGERWAAFDAAEDALCRLLRDLFGNSFLPISLTTAHRTPTILSIARAAYEERQLPSGELDIHRLAVLADALEEAGAPGELVAHLRGPGPHVRGCHVIDLILGLS